MSEQETGFRTGADGWTYYTDTGKRTKKTRLFGGLRRFGKGAAVVGGKAAIGAGRLGYRAGKGTVNVAARHGTGLSVSELREYNRLLRMERAGVFTRDENYLLEVKRLKALEARYRATTGKRRKEIQQLKRAVKRSGFMQGRPRRLRA